MKRLIGKALHVVRISRKYMKVKPAGKVYINICIKVNGYKRGLSK